MSFFFFFKLVRLFFCYRESAKVWLQCRLFLRDSIFGEYEMGEILKIMFDWTTYDVNVMCCPHACCEVRCPIDSGKNKEREGRLPPK